MTTRSDGGLPGGAVADPWTAPQTSMTQGDPPPAGSLRSFSQTAQHPQVTGPGRAGPDPRFLPTGMVPAVGRPVVLPAPLLLRLVVWLCVLLILAGVAGIAVHHFRPAWLRDIESAAAAGPSAPRAPGSGAATTAPTVPRSVTRSVVDIVDNGNGTGTITVHSPSYTVVVQATGACWVSVTGAGTGTVFGQTMQAGATQNFPAQRGPLQVNLGSSHVTLSVQVDGKTVPGSQFSPRSAPYDLTFTSAS